MAEKGRQLLKALDNKITFEVAQAEVANHIKDLEQNVLRKKRK